MGYDFRESRDNRGLFQFEHFISTKGTRAVESDDEGNRIKFIFHL